jgi:hypothetical protein
MQDFCFLTLVLKSVKMKKDHLKLLKKNLFDHRYYMYGQRHFLNIFQQNALHSKEKGLSYFYLL